MVKTLKVIIYYCTMLYCTVLCGLLNSNDNNNDKQKNHDVKNKS